MNEQDPQRGRIRRIEAAIAADEAALARLREDLRNRRVSRAELRGGEVPWPTRLRRPRAPRAACTGSPPRPASRPHRRVVG